MALTVLVSVSFSQVWDSERVALLRQESMVQVGEQMDHLVVLANIVFGLGGKNVAARYAFVGETLAARSIRITRQTLARHWSVHVGTYVARRVPGVKPRSCCEIDLPAPLLHHYDLPSTPGRS